jgi:hypothetical protein
MSDDDDYYDDLEIIWIEEPEPGIAVRTLSRSTIRQTH